MKILYVAGREASYSRTHNIFKALQRQGFDVTGCFPPDKSFKHYPKLILRAIQLSRGADLLLVGFYGQIILPILKLFIQKPVLFDMYIATYDTMVHDRGKADDNTLKAKLYKWSDRLSCRLSRSIILETNDHIQDFAKKFAVSPEKFRRIFLAVDDELIYPREAKKNSDKFLVHFHGEYAPFHGVQYILKAAALLRDRDIEFQIVGKGITYDADMRLAKELNLQNVRFYDPVPYEKLADFMAHADVCLGIFGHNNRMLRVTTNKVIESIAMQKALITGRNQPVQELLKHEESVYLVERANPQALAAAILKLKENVSLREKLARAGYRIFKENCTIDVLGSELKKIVQELKANENGKYTVA